MVFLATSTNSFGAVPGLTGSQDAGVLAPDTTVPAVPGGIEASGGGCTAATEEDANRLRTQMIGSGYRDARVVID